MNDQTRIHYARCEEQPEGYPCICDHIADELDEAYEKSIDSQIDDLKENQNHE